MLLLSSNVATQDRAIYKPTKTATMLLVLTGADATRRGFKCGGLLGVVL